MTQTLALLVDAYRELNSKKLFWIVLILSFIFVALFACIGIDEQGLTVLVWSFPIEFANSKLIPPPLFYKQVFFAFGFELWLTWAAAVLALISTAGIIPDFVGSGSVDLVLSKPIGRFRLFLTKYATGLLFVLLQVAAFSLASFLVIGLRGGAWVWAIFLAVPLVVCFFSYLYAVSALVGLVTRSAIAALVMTLLFWFVLFMLHGGEVMFLNFRVMNDIEVERREAAVARIQVEIDGEAGEARRERLRRERADEERRLDEAREDRRRWTRVHRAVYAVKTVLPKTSETMQMLGNALISDEDLERMRRQQKDSREDLGPFGRGRDAAAAAERMEKILRGRSTFWILGTSLGFEAVLLLLGGWIFRRRDY